MFNTIKNYFQKRKLIKLEKAEIKRMTDSAREEYIRIHNANGTLWAAEQKYDRGHPAYLPTIDD